MLPGAICVYTQAERPGIKKVEQLDRLLNKAQAYADFIVKRQSESFQLPTSAEEVG